MADQAATTRPAPSRVHPCARGPNPFIGCFGRFEKEAAAAIYVSACVANGDEWKPVGPRDFGMELTRLATASGALDAAGAAGNGEAKSVQSWVSFLVQFRYTPDVLGLVEGGFLEMDSEQRVTPTEAFFEKIEPFVAPEAAR